MKLPVSFGNRLFLRMLIPGGLLSVGLYPGCVYFMQLASYHLNPTVFFTLAPVFLGWLFTLSDMRIYMLFEGRRYWPAPLRKAGIARQQQKLERWLKKAKSDDNGIEFDVKAHRYPLSDGVYPPGSDQPSAAMPTELGNVIYGFETYPMTKYGVDGVFFWPRILMSLSKDLRDEIDEGQSLCDSALYSAFACLMNSALFFSYAILDIFTSFMLIAPNTQFAGIVIAVGFALLAVFLYRSAITANEQFGERIKAMFDTNLDALGIDGACKMIAVKTGTYFSDGYDPKKALAAWRYLRWHLYRPPGTEDNVDIETVRRN